MDMMRLLKYVVLAFLACSCARSDSADLERMRFHCANDTVKINRLLEQGLASGKRDANSLVKFYAERLLGTPYVGHTLEGASEMLTIDIDELDCTTFVETLYALSRTTLDGHTSWRDYASHLESVRYRGGVMGDYSTRLHYISDWIIDNNSRSNLVEVTGDLPHAEHVVKTINFMSEHSGSYVSLKNDEQMTKRIIAVEAKLRNHRMPVLKKSWLGSKEVKAALRDGDFIGLVTNVKGLDISHMGIISKNAKGEVYLLDASMRGGKVMLESRPLHLYLNGKKSTTTAVRIFRIM